MYRVTPYLLLLLMLLVVVVVVAEVTFLPPIRILERIMIEGKGQGGK